MPGIPILCPLKTSENNRFSDGFRSYKEVAPGTNWLRMYCVYFLHMPVIILIVLSMHVSRCTLIRFRGHPLSTYGTGGEGSSKVRTAACRGRSDSHIICTYALALYLFIFVEECLSYTVLYYLQKFNFMFIHMRCACQKWLFFSNEMSVCHDEINFFNSFLQTKFSQYASFFSDRILGLLYILVWYLTLKNFSAA